MFIQNNKICINKDINKKYPSKSYNKFFFSKNIDDNQIDLKNKSEKFIIPISKPFDYFLLLSLMSIWLGNLTRRKLHNLFQKKK